MNKAALEKSIALRGIYAACLLGATFNHLSIVLHDGLFWTYGGQPWFTAAFWTALTFLDPLAAALLFIRPNAGVAMTLAIMLVDVPHNLWVITHGSAFLLPRIAKDPMVMEQIAFLVFVLATVRFATVLKPASKNA